MVVMMMWVVVRVVGWMVVVVLLLLFPGARQRLQEHLLWRDGAERHKASSGAEGTHKHSGRATTTHAYILYMIVDDEKGIEGNCKLTNGF